jgi:hypothetical protein
MKLKTKEMNGRVIRLRFEDNNNHFYRIIESNNLRIAKYYANKVERTQNCVLTDIVEISLVGDILYIAKDSFRYTCRHLRNVRLSNSEFQLCLDLSNGRISHITGIDFS